LITSGSEWIFSSAHSEARDQPARMNRKIGLLSRAARAKASSDQSSHWIAWGSAGGCPAVAGTAGFSSRKTGVAVERTRAMAAAVEKNDADRLRTCDLPFSWLAKGAAF